MESKKLRFAGNLAPLVLSGKKNVTWRMFDDKNLTGGDRLILINRDTNEEFARADIVEMREKKFGDIGKDDFQGHEEFANVEEMNKTYNLYYDGKVKSDTMVKIIKFTLIK